MRERERALELQRKRVLDRERGGQVIESKRGEDPDGFSQRIPFGRKI